MDPISYSNNYTPQTTQPAAPAAMDRGHEENNAMEAVRELLFGKRVAEFHAQMESLEQRINLSIQRLEGYAQQRFTDLERSLQESERRLMQALSNEGSDRRNESVSAKKMTDERFSLMHRNMETFALETAKHLEARRSELQQARKEFAAETQHLREHTPTLHSLADLFQHTSHQLRSALPQANQTASTPAETHPRQREQATAPAVLEGLPG